MNSQDFENLRKGIPDNPGVYYFWQGNTKLYIGKATSIKDRTSSYFKPEVVLDRGPKIAKMVELADKITFEETDSVLEAVILEAKLIKKYQPYYNTIQKDDKSFWFVVVTKEEFPRVYLIREKELEQQNLAGIKFQGLYGPFPSGLVLREALKILRRIFPFRDKKSTLAFHERFYRELGLVPDVSNKVKAQAYNRTIGYLKMFFEGKKSALLKTIEKDMKALARAEKFEEANVLKNTLFALSHIHDVSLIRAEHERSDKKVLRVDALDVAHLAGTFTYGVSVTIEQGMPVKEWYRTFRMRIEHKGDDYAALQELMHRRLSHDEWGIPDVLVIDGGILHKKVAEHCIGKFEAWQNVQIVAVTKDERHKPVKILGDAKLITKYKQDILKANAEAHRFAITTHRKRRDQVR